MIARPVRVRLAGPSDARRAAKKAAELLASAQRSESAGDWTLAMIGYCHAGIHASDALCAKANGATARDSDHAQAVQLLRQVQDGAKMAAHLQRIVQLKKQWSYEVEDIGAGELRSLGRAATALVRAANASR